MCVYCVYSCLFAFYIIFPANNFFFKIQLIQMNPSSHNYNQKFVLVFVLKLYISSGEIIALILWYNWSHDHSLAITALSKEVIQIQLWDLVRITFKMSIIDTLLKLHQHIYGNVNTQLCPPREQMAHREYKTIKRYRTEFYFILFIYVLSLFSSWAYLEF